MEKGPSSVLDDTLVLKWGLNSLRVKFSGNWPFWEMSTWAQLGMWDSEMSPDPPCPTQLVWPGLVQASLGSSFGFLALMTRPAPPYLGLRGFLCRYVQGLNSKQCLLDCKYQWGGGVGTSLCPGLLCCRSHASLSGPCPSHHVRVRGHLCGRNACTSPSTLGAASFPHFPELPVPTPLGRTAVQPPFL